MSSNSPPCSSYQFRGVSPTRNDGPLRRERTHPHPRPHVPLRGWRESKAVSPRPAEDEPPATTAAARRKRPPPPLKKLKRELTPEVVQRTLSRVLSGKDGEDEGVEMVVEAGAAEGVGIHTMWSVAGGQKFGPLFELLVEKGAVEPGTAEEARHEAATQKKIANNALTENLMLRQALLRCEAHARPHLVNAEYDPAWYEAPGLLPDNNRSASEIAADAVHNVSEACRLLVYRRDLLLSEVCESSQESRRLELRVAEEEAAKRSAEAEAEAARTEVEALRRELAEKETVVTRLAAVEASRDKTKGELTKARKELDKLVFENSQLRIEINKVVRRGGLRKQPVPPTPPETHSAQQPQQQPARQKLENPPSPWVPVGGPYRHLLDEDNLLHARRKLG